MENEVTHRLVDERVSVYNGAAYPGMWVMGIGDDGERIAEFLPPQCHTTKKFKMVTNTLIVHV